MSTRRLGFASIVEAHGFVTQRGAFRVRQLVAASADCLGLDGVPGVFLGARCLAAFMVSLSHASR